MNLRAPTALVLLLCSAALLACPEDEPGQPPGAADAATLLPDASHAPDASEAADTGAGAPDAGTTDAGAGPACAVGADDCLSNLDCAPSELCHRADPQSAMGCCATGARGAGVAGDTCSSAGQCAIGLCLTRNDGQSFCSGTCPNDMGCPSFMRCSDVFHWCVPRDTTEVPADCGTVSLGPCAYNENCLDHQRCENVGDATHELFCCTEGARGTGLLAEPCASELDCVFGRCIGGVCSAYCDFDVDPCPPETMECNTIVQMCEPI